MSVKWLLQSQLIEMVANKTNRSAKDEQSIQASERHQILDFRWTESSARSQHVHKAYSDAAIHVEDQVCPLEVVACSTARAKFKRLLSLKCLKAYSFIITTR